MGTAAVAERVGGQGRQPLPGISRGGIFLELSPRTRLRPLANRRESSSTRGEGKQHVHSYTTSAPL